MQKDKSLKITLIIITLFLLSGVYQNCSGEFKPISYEINQNSNTNDPPEPVEDPAEPVVKNFEGDLVLQEAALGIVSMHCALCHDQANFGEVTNILSVNHLVDSGLVVPGDATLGRLVGSMEDGTMPPGGTPVPPEEIQALKDWIATIVEVEAPVDPDPVVDPPPILPLAATWASIYQNILVPKCVGCHSPNGTRPQEDYSTYEAAIQTGGVEPGAPLDSDLYDEVERGKMPKRPAPALAAEEIQVIFDWILGGALNN